MAKQPKHQITKEPTPSTGIGSKSQKRAPVEFQTRLPSEVGGVAAAAPAGICGACQNEEGASLPHLHDQRCQTAQLCSLRGCRSLRHDSDSFFQLSDRNCRGGISLRGFQVFQPLD